MRTHAPGSKALSQCNRLNLIQGPSADMKYFLFCGLTTDDFLPQKTGPSKVFHGLQEDK